MRRDLGSVTGILAILAIALHTAFPTAPEGGPAPAKTETSSSKPSSEPKPDEPPEGPWLATRAYFPPDYSSVPIKKTLAKNPLDHISESTPITNSKYQIDHLRELFGIPPCRSIYSIVATVPDPLHTRLALSFDVAIEAIERAAEHQGWTFARQWLPWLDPASGGADDISERRHQRRLEREQESLPGILIFRPSRAVFPLEKPESLLTDVLLVFLVPETPTGAIADDSFYAALNFASLLPDAASSTHEIGLLAPTYSGSFRSLTRLLQVWTNKKPKRLGPRLHRTIFGGWSPVPGTPRIFLST